jgi:5,10-methylenetetrahydrofolate reductase
VATLTPGTDILAAGWLVGLVSIPDGVVRMVQLLQFYPKLITLQVLMLSFAISFAHPCAPHLACCCSVQLWGVGNPVVEQDTARLDQKADAGAEAFLTQPPLAWNSFEQWMEDARRRSIHDRCRILIGIPMLTSAAHLRFWIVLCGAQVQGALCHVLACLHPDVQLLTF